MEKVKEMMKSMGVSIPTGGQQLMNQIEQQQLHQTQVKFCNCLQSLLPH